MSGTSKVVPENSLKGKDIYEFRNKTFNFKEGEKNEKIYITDNGIIHKNLSNIANIKLTETISTVDYGGKVAVQAKYEKDLESEEFDNATARSVRAQNFHKTATEATKLEKDPNDKGLDSLIKEVKGTEILVKLLCSEISGFPALTNDNVTISGLIEVALSIEQGETNPKISFLVVKGVIDFNLVESFFLQERTCCCFNYAIGNAFLDYETKRNATSQFSTLPVDACIIDAMCYSNENTLYKATSQPESSSAELAGNCCLLCFQVCMFCYNCKCCDCCACCACPVYDTIKTKTISVKASDTHIIGSEIIESRGDIVKEEGLKFKIKKEVEKEGVVVFYYLSPLDKKNHKCTLKLKQSDFTGAKRFVNLLGKYRTKVIDHREVYAEPVGIFNKGVSAAIPNASDYFKIAGK